MWLRELVSLFALPFARFAIPSSIPSASVDLLPLLLPFSLAILSRVLLCKLLSDRDNQINRLKRSSDKVNRTTDLLRSISLSFSLSTFTSSGKKNKSAWQHASARFRFVLDHFLSSAGVIRVLFRVCAALRSGFSNGRISHHYVNYCVICTRRHSYAVIAIIKLIGLNICRKPSSVPRRIERGRKRAEPDRLRFGRLYFSLFFLIGLARSRRRNRQKRG